MVSKHNGIFAKENSAQTNADTKLLSDEDHPDFVPGIINDQIADLRSLTPRNDDLPLPPIPRFPNVPVPRQPRIPDLPIGDLPNRPIPLPFPTFCAAVSGRYQMVAPLHNGAPNVPFPNLQMTVRIDVDRFLPQHRISIEVIRLFPQATAHVIAEVSSDQCLAFNHRRIEATITYRDGDPGLIPGSLVTFEASRGLNFTYSKYNLKLSGPGMVAKSYALEFQSQYFDIVEFEIDQVDNAPGVITSYDISSHPNRPSNLPAETISLATVYQRAGFDATLSPNANSIPNTDAGDNDTWSDSEMHDAMITYWSRFSDQPQWALWVLFAARHDSGRGLGGVMFDDIGPNHRQGTAIFTDSFIQDAPAGDPNPATWAQRMTFWTATHEMGHAFNLAHSWQKALGNPWLGLANAPEARSFMNYPYRVGGGEAAFFSDFRFRFSDEELVFMRHAPRRFVQMGNANWFDHHAFEAPDRSSQSGNWKLELRPNRNENLYQFLEPVVMELKLTNSSSMSARIDKHLLSDGGHITVFIQRQGGKTKQWHAMSTQCHEEHAGSLAPGKSVYGAHLISASGDGWLIDEPGFYKVQAAIQIENEILLSNVQKLYVANSTGSEQERLALDYFTEDVGRILVFNGAPSLNNASNTLRNLLERCPETMAAVHARLALSAPKLFDFKRLETGRDRSGLAIRCERAEIDAAWQPQSAMLMEAANIAVHSLGHIKYFAKIEELAAAISEAGNESSALEVRQKSLLMMKQQKILPALIKEAELALRAD